MVADHTHDKLDGEGGPHASLDGDIMTLDLAKEFPDIMDACPY